ncbi:MAG: hypothetical protein D6722_02890 [Bacteroidetes bacterium]|nr:MAG: hypothetical protein D6722_02890 [Bacteroidota bacterium]
MRYRLGSRLSLFYECALSQRNTQIRQAELLTFERDQTDLRADLAPFQQQVRFTPDLQATDNFPQNPDFDPEQPLTTTAEPQQLRTFQVSMGVTLSLDR